VGSIIVAIICFIIMICSIIVGFGGTKTDKGCKKKFTEYLLENDTAFNKQDDDGEGRSRYILYEFAKNKNNFRFGEVIGGYGTSLKTIEPPKKVVYYKPTHEPGEHYVLFFGCLCLLKDNEITEINNLSWNNGYRDVWNMEERDLVDANFETIDERVFDLV